MINLPSLTTFLIDSMFYGKIGSSNLEVLVLIFWFSSASAMYKSYNFDFLCLYFKCFLLINYLMCFIIKLAAMYYSSKEGNPSFLTTLSKSLRLIFLSEGLLYICLSDNFLRSGFFSTSGSSSFGEFKALGDFLRGLL